MTMTEERAKLTSAERDALPDSAFALPGRRYPIHDENHARAALSEVAQHGTPDEKAKVRAAVHKRYPHIGAGDGDRAQHDPAWEQRRKRWAHSLLGQTGRRSLAVQRGNLEVRAKPDGTGGTRFEFRGYAATFGDPFEMWDKWGDPYEEEVIPGAFSHSVKRDDLITPFLIGHNEADLPLARTWDTMKLSQDSRGLETFANMNGKRSDVQNLACAVEDNNVDEMSVGFVTRGQEWSSDYSKRYMTDMDIHRGDVSVVALAANPATKGVSMIALPTEVLSRQAAAERAAAAAAITQLTEGWNASEYRGNPVDQDMGDASDYDAAGQMRCTNSDCQHTADMQPPGAKFCSYCGDALVRLNEDGVPGMEEEQGAEASLSANVPNAETLSAWLELERISA